MWYKVFIRIQKYSFYLFFWSVCEQLEPVHFWTFSWIYSFKNKLISGYIHIRKSINKYFECFSLCFFHIQILSMDPVDCLQKRKALCWNTFSPCHLSPEWYCAGEKYQTFVSFLQYFYEFLWYFYEVSHDISLYLSREWYCPGEKHLYLFYDISMNLYDISFVFLWYLFWYFFIFLWYL